MSNIAMTMGLGSNDLNRPIPPAVPEFTYVGASFSITNMDIQVPSGAPLHISREILQHKIDGHLMFSALLFIPALLLSSCSTHVQEETQ